MTEDVRLPSSSLNELKKIIQGYSNLGESVQLDDLAKLLAISRTTISPNNPALTDLGLIDGGKTKNTTPLGSKLGRALEHNHIEDTKRYFQEIVQNSQFLSNIISTVRIKKGMTVDGLASHILYASGLKNSKANRTGARAYADLLIESGLLVESNGQVSVATINSTDKPIEEPTNIPVVSVEPPEEVNKKISETIQHAKSQQVEVTTTPTKIAINIQLQIPATDNPKVYENLFKALRTQLLNPSKTDDTE